LLLVIAMAVLTLAGLGASPSRPAMRMSWLDVELWLHDNRS